MGSIAVVIIIVFGIFSLFEAIHFKKLEEELKQTREYNKTLSTLNDNVRGFKHDFSNILTTIGGYIYVNDIEGLKKYYSDLKTDCDKLNSLSALNPDVINHPAIYAILSSKYHEAEENGIAFNLDVFMDLSKINLNIYEFTRILGILLNNALEAANECEDKIINVRIYKDSKSNRQVLIVENTYSNKKINTNMIFEKGYSGKPNHTGLGLWEVRQILKKHNNLNLFTTSNEKFFKQQLEIYVA